MIDELFDGDRFVPTTPGSNLGRATITLRSKPWSSDGSHRTCQKACSRVPASLALHEVWFASASWTIIALSLLDYSCMIASCIYRHIWHTNWMHILYTIHWLCRSLHPHPCTRDHFSCNLVLMCMICTVLRLGPVLMGPFVTCFVSLIRSSIGCTAVCPITLFGFHRDTASRQCTEFELAFALSKLACDTHHHQLQYCHYWGLY